MPDIGAVELLLIAIVGLLVIGPERLPETLRTLGLWMGRMRRSFNAVKTEIEKEIGMDEVKRQLHNEAIMEEMKRIEAEVKNTADAAKGSLNEGMQAAGKSASPTPAAQSTLPKTDPNVDAEISDLIAAQDGNVSEPGSANDYRDHSDAGAEADNRDHSDAGAEADNRDHGDAAAEADDRNHSDAAGRIDSEDDRDHTDAGGEPESKPSPQRVTGG
jgi:sec-independent protein translocase protein TatB